MEQIELAVANRETLGKKVRFLRRQGVTPLHLFGHGIESMALQCANAELRRVLARAGRTRLIRLTLNNEKEPRTVLVREVQREPLTGETLHVDFYEVIMSERVKMEIPIILVGEAPALKLKENRLVQEMNVLTVECLPANIPTSIELDITSLAELDQAARVKDIALDKEVTVLNNPEQVLVRISLRPVERVEEKVVAEEAIEAPEATEASAVAPVAEEKSKKG